MNSAQLILLVFVVQVFDVLIAFQRSTWVVSNSRVLPRDVHQVIFN